ncbi:MAG: hypothetical protein O3A01_03030 [bacterium]|nr:hypothetical protein [bacterium]
MAINAIDNSGHYMGGVKPMMRLKRYSFVLFRFLVTSIGLTQRLPYIALYLSGLVVVLALYKVAKTHRLLIRYHSAMIRLFFLLNGIRLKYDKATLSKLSHAAIISNYFSGIDLAIMLVVLPYEKLQFLPPQFFKAFPFKSLLHLMGFYPKETDFDIRNYATKSFHADPYAKAGYLLIESVRVASQSHQAIPYVLMLAIKHQLRIVYLELRGNENSKFATLFKPRTITITIIDEAVVSKRIDLTVMHYRRVLERFESYGKSRRYMRVNNRKASVPPHLKPSIYVAKKPEPIKPESTTVPE